MLKRIWREGNILHCWWGCKLIEPRWRIVWRFLKKLGICLNVTLSNHPIFSLPSCVQKSFSKSAWESTIETYILPYVKKISSVAQSCSTLCNPKDCNTPGFPVHHQLLELAYTQVHQVGDAIQPSHPLLSLSPPAFNLSQHWGLFQWVNSSHKMARVLELQLQHQSFKWMLLLLLSRFSCVQLWATP